LLRNFYKDKFFWIAAIIGLVFMLFTLYFNINPVEGSVVPEYIQGTAIHIFLFFASMPGWIVGLMVSGVLPVPFPVVACIIQILFYGILGKIIHRAVDFFKRQ
jgi:ABC-type transport system involved in multi-copper enzyme maturation permease subunit